MARRPRPWYRNARQSWFVTIGGVQHNLGPDKNEAFEQFYALMRKRQLNKQVARESLLEICDRFLDWNKQHRKADTFEWYRIRLQDFIAGNSELQVADLRPFHVQQWVDRYPNHAPVTRRNNIRAIKRCLRWALKQGYIDENPIAQMEMPSAQPRDKIITSEQFEELLSFVTDRSFRDLLVVTWETGCRPQESLRVEKRHVDLANSRWVFPCSEAKGERMPRVVYLTESAREITERLVMANPHEKLFRNSKGRSWNKQSVSCAFGRVQLRMGKRVMSETGKLISDTQIAKKIPRLNPTRKSAGRNIDKTSADLRCEAKRKLTDQLCRRLAPRYSLYTLRHSWATNALQNGVDALTVAILMGHKDPSTLARTYQHLSHNPEHLLEQARRAAG